MISERIKNIRDISFDYNEMLKYIKEQTAEFTPNPSRSRILRHADAVCAVFDQLNTNYIPGSLIAGNGGDKFMARPDHLLPEEYEEIEAYPKNCKPETLEALREEIFYIWPFSDGHIAPGFDQLLKTGVNGLIAEIEDRLKDASLTPYQIDFLTASRLEWQAMLRLAARYSEFFRKMAASAGNAAQRQEYAEIADIIAKVPAQPAGSFREAIQSVYFMHMCTQFDDVSNHSFGRFDQYLYPYYKADIENGKITGEFAEDLFQEFWLKFTPGYIKSRKEGARSEGQGFVKQNIPENGLTWMTLKAISHVKHVDDGQTMDLCGFTPDGADGTNEISRMAIRAVDTFRTFEPKPVVKYTEKTDPAFMDLCYRLLASGHGHPAITYHKSGVKGMGKYKNYYRPEDLLNYCHIGCVELGIGGMSYTDPMNAFVNLPKILLITMGGGTLNGKLLGLKQDPPATYEDFRNNYYSQLGYFLDLYVEETNRANPFYAQYFFRPMVSGAIEGCIKNATPVDEGGSRYWSKSINCSGFATAADSLFTVKELVYHKKSLTLEQFNEILKSDYEGQEVLRNRIVHKLPKYGNGIQEVDGIAAHLARYYCDEVCRHKTYVGTPYRPGIYSFYESINRMGKITGATPNGRKAGERFSLNASPVHGAIHSGITSALQSMTSFPHLLADNACPVDVQLPTGVTPEVIRYINEYLFGHGALYLQITVANREDLVKAERDPREYQDLVVRVTGFSAQYVSLDEQTRHEIIERTSWM